MNVTLKRLLGVLLTLILLALFTRLLDVPSVIGRLEHLRVIPALLCGAAFLGAYVVRALRWRCFLGPRPPSTRRLVCVYQIAVMINWLLPVQGGELVKCELLRRSDGLTLSRSLPTVAMDKMMDLLPAAVLLAALPFLPFQLDPLLWMLLLILTAMLLAGVAILVVAAWKRELALSLMSRAAAKLPGRLRSAEAAIERLVEVSLTLAGQPRLILKAAALTAVAVALDAVFCLLAFQAIGADVAFPVTLYGYTLFNLAFILPTLPGQVGSNELIGLLVFAGVMHIDRSAVAAMFLFSHPWTALLIVGSGALSLSSVGLSLSSTLEIARRKGRRSESDQAARPVEGCSSSPEIAKYAAAAFPTPSDRLTAGL